jgi:predicted dehydrogenase
MVERALIVGHGSIGKRHLRIARGLLPSADIRVLSRAMCDTVPEYADGWLGSMEEALEFKPQVAVIANPSTFHIKTAQPLAEAGVHLLVEKPLANSIEGVCKLLSACRAHGSVLMVGYNLRFLPCLQKFRELIRSGFIGKVISVRCEIGQYLPSWRPDIDYRQSVSALHDLGGGALLELSHEIDYMRWIFGEAEWVKATLSKQSSLEIDVEDTAHLILGFSPEGDGRQIVANLTLDFVRQDTTRQCTAIGEKGSLRWNALSGEIQFFTTGGASWETVFQKTSHRDGSYMEEWRHLLDCISAGKSPMVSGQDGLEVLKIIDAARRSDAEHKGALVID